MIENEQPSRFQPSLNLLAATCVDGENGRIQRKSLSHGQKLAINCFRCDQIFRPANCTSFSQQFTRWFSLLPRVSAMHSFSFQRAGNKMIYTVPQNCGSWYGDSQHEHVHVEEWRQPQRSHEQCSLFLLTTLTCWSLVCLTISAIVACQLCTAEFFTSAYLPQFSQ